KGSRKKKEKEPGGIRKWVPLIAGCIFTVLLLMGAILARYLGYLPAIKVEMLIAAGIFTACLIVLLGYVIPDDGEPLERTLPEEYIQPEKTERTEEEVPVERRNVGLKRYSRIPSGEYGETVILSSEPVRGPATLVSREPGELATIYLQEELTLVGKMETAADAVIDLPTVSRLHAKIRKKGEDYFLSDLNSRNGTAVNGRMLRADEEYLLQEEDQVDFAQARYIFLK
ncbi:MAG: FHA domain-containing protein, partial [Clostridiales bacterium]|nr:FHA domain-containing protein [Candidatus Blautia equi]